MDWIKNILDLSKIPVKVILLIVLVSGSLLFLPESSIELLNLSQFKADYGKFFGVFFLVSGGLLILNSVFWFLRWRKAAKVKRKFRKVSLEAIENLDQHEKAVLREFFIQGKNTLRIPIDEPTVSGLLQKRVLRRVSSMGQVTLSGATFPLTISKFALENIIPSIHLEIPDGDLSDEQIRTIQELRPKWTRTNTLLDRLSDLY